MRSVDPGIICEGLWLLGRPESCVYVLEGSERTMLVSGGMSHILPEALKQMDRFGIDPDRITDILILHSHFDHIGIIPYFLKKSPEPRIHASSRAWQILGDPKKVDTINAFNRGAAARVGSEKVIDEYDLVWPHGVIGRTVSEGMVIDLGNLDLRIVDTPGHSSCSISAYAPKLKALFPSDGGGIPYRDSVVISGNSNYTQCQQSLEKLASLDVSYLCADHFGYIAGDEANTFASDAVEQAARERELLEAVYRRTKDVNTAAEEVASAFYDDNPEYFLPIELYTGICRQIMRHIASCMDA